MRTNVNVNDELVQKAMAISRLSTKEAVVEVALQQYIERQARQNLLSLFGKVNWEGDLEQMRTNTAPNDWDQ